MLQLVERLGAADEESLQFLTANVAQEVGLEARLDTFGGAPHAQRVRQRNCSLRDGAAIGLVFNIANKALVDLDLVEREAAQIGQRGIARTEIVQRDAHTNFLQLVQSLERESGVRHQHRFRNFQFETARVGLVGGNCIHDRRHQI